MRLLAGKARDADGQMTVELVVALPVLIVVAVIAYNALAFLGECAVFDRVAHEAARTHAAAPAYGQGPDQCCALIQQEIVSALGSGDDVTVTHATTGLDFDAYTATISYAPTLFGLGLRSEVLGVPLPHLTHETVYVVDSYKAGVFI